MPGPENRSHDRRSRRTKKLLRDALLSLIREKPYDDIVVKEILARADIGRSTFYAHFHDKDELLNSGIHEMLRSGASARGRSAQRHELLVWFSLPVFEFVGQHRHTAADDDDDDGDMADNGWSVVHEHLEQFLIEEVTADVRRARVDGQSSAGDIPPDLLVRHVVATFILVLNWWVGSRSTLSSVEVDALFRALIAPALPMVVG